MQKILITAALCLASAALHARPASLLVYRVWEQGVEPYVSRILVTEDYLRLDEGAESDGYTLFDRQQEILYNVSPQDRSVLVMNPTGLAPDDNAGLILQEEVVEDKQAPMVAGQRPRQVRLLANGEVCTELVVIGGVMDAALEGLSELKLVLARIQGSTLDALPLDARTPCQLASDLYAPDRSLQFGLPLQERSPGRSQSLVDFTDDFDADDALFEVPDAFDRRPMFAPGAI